MIKNAKKELSRITSNPLSNEDGLKTSSPTA